MLHRGVRPEAEMAQDYAHEQYPGRTEGYALEGQLPQPEAYGDDHGEEQDGICRSAYHTKLNVTSVGMRSTLMFMKSPSRSVSTWAYSEMKSAAAFASPSA